MCYNFVGKLHNTKQHIQFIKFIKNEITLSKFLTSYSNLQGCEDISLLPIKLYKNNGFDIQFELTNDYNCILQTDDELLEDLQIIRELIPKNKKYYFKFILDLILYIMIIIERLKRERLYIK